MIRKLFFLPLILVFISCTVTKRVHRPGYHVQWHKVERTKKSDKDEAKFKESKPSKSQDEIKLELAEINEINLNEIDPKIASEAPVISEDQIVDESDIPEVESAIQEINTSPTQSERAPEIRSVSTSARAPIFWRTPPENLKKLGIALMITGGIILWGALLGYFGAFSGSGDSAWLNFFLDLLDISGWFWLLFFILAIILVSYLSFLFVMRVLGGPLVGLIVGLGLAAIGLFFYTLGVRREPEPPR
ncbi:MAG: hypothetical protein P8P74_08990 [Crocinitomicaceae bacterium]|nr:hypothetical protein [Crocinitomicaceae bacterium]